MAFLEMKLLVDYQNSFTVRMIL